MTSVAERLRSTRPRLLAIPSLADPTTGCFNSARLLWLAGFRNEVASEPNPAMLMSMGQAEQHQDLRCGGLGWDDVQNGCITMIKWWTTYRGQFSTAGKRRRPTCGSFPSLPASPHPAVALGNRRPYVAVGDTVLLDAINLNGSVARILENCDANYRHCGAIGLVWTGWEDIRWTACSG